MMQKIEDKTQVPHTVYYSVRVSDEPGPRPLLIALHGFGQNASDFAKVFEPLVEKGITVVAPQAANQFYTNIKKRQVGFTWLTAYQRDQSIQDFANYMEELFRILCGRFEIDQQQVFLAGFSQGGAMAFRTWVHSSLPVKGIISCAGDLPEDCSRHLNRVDSVPVLLIHGSDDRYVLPEKSENAKVLLEEREFPVRLLYFSGGHYVTSKVLPDIETMILGNSEGPATNNPRT